MLASLAGIALGLAPLGTTYTLGVLTGPLQAAFGWSRAEVQAATLAQTAAALPAAFAVGWAADRLGVRRLVIAGQLGLALSFLALSAFTRSLWGFYALYALMGAVAASTMPVTFARAITGWFARARGLALGIALAGTGLCGFAVPPLLTAMVAEHGWQGGYVLLALLPLAVALPLAALLLRDPPARAAATAATEGVPFAAAIRSRRFWTMAVAFLLIAGAVTGILTNLVPLLTDRGLPPAPAASLAALVGLAVIAGRLVVGWLADRMWAPLVGVLFLLPSAAAALVLAGGTTSEPLLALAIVALGLGLGAEIDLSAYLTSRYFGLLAYGRIYAALYIVLAVGAGAASPVFGAVFDAQGSYRPALLAAAAIFAGAPLLLLTLGRYARE